ncbi:AcvB/VirJ family lysyl-phosphatidylglycerol hydrolase [Desertivirga brevis]|uniref:AcvB/VirJ family lysyl-phosphatidylglycerol hydrolase n=1 Tax=Desertivirga brevis TaxID=2810310 RepID=UPI001A9731F2|nr:AcvB/VirJ family lysyl-phosphatidylglycerol hydrolase [Pedobacter sp. SYSU D00873]
MQSLKNIIAVIILCTMTGFTAFSRSAADLPLNVLKPKTDKGDRLILFVTGDGGWNSFSEQLAKAYTAQGVPVLALNSLKYFWKKKNPQEAANDISALLNKYTKEWQKSEIVLVGYSFGADVIPFIYRRLPETLRDKIVLLQLLSPASFTDFEIHISDLFGSKNPVRSMNIGAELKQADVPTLCYYGRQEAEKPLANQQKEGFKVVLLPGDHHYKNSFTEIAKAAASR